MNHNIDPFFRRLFTVIAFGLFVYVLYLTKSVLAPFAAAFILAYFLNPLVSQLAKIMPRILAISIVYISVILLFTGLTIWLAPLLWVQLQLLWESIPRIVTWYNTTARAWIGQYTHNTPLKLETDFISNALLDYIQNNYQVSDAQDFIKRAVSSSMAAANNFGIVVMVPVLTFYFLIDWYGRLQTWQSALPKPYAQKITQIASDCDKALMNFAKGQLLVMLLLGLIYAVQLHFIGLQLGLIIGISAGIASFVPYLGFGIGIIAALAAGVFQFGFDWLYLGLIVGAFMIGQVLESYVLQPYLLGDKIGLSPLWVIFAVLAGAALFGFVGMLIALPISAVINVLFQHAYQAYLNSRWYLGDKTQ